MRLRDIAIAACVVAAVFWLAAVMLNRLSSSGPRTAEVEPVSEEPTEPRAVPSIPIINQSPFVPMSSSGSSAPAIAVSWEKRRDDLLISAAPAAEKAEQLLGLLPQLAESQQQEAAKHLANLLSDEQFPTAGAYLTNAQAPTNIQSVLMADLFNRPERIKLPLCLAILRTPDHPQAEQAKSLLTLYLSEDHGTNWPAWEEALRTRLQANP